MRRTAAFISAKWMNEKKRVLRKLLSAKLYRQSPLYAAYEVEDLRQFWKNLYTDLISFGLNDFAERSLKERVDAILSYVDGVAASLRRFNDACEIVLPHNAEPLQHAVWQLRYERGNLFEKSVKTLGDAFRWQWHAAADADENLMRRVLSKATPEELAAISSEDLSSKTLDVKYGFWNRVGVDKIAKRTTTRTKLDWDPMGRLVLLLNVLTSSYTQEGLAGFDAFREFNIGNMRVIIVDPEMSMFSPRWYVSRLVEAKRMLEQYGFGKLWYGVLFIKSEQAEQLSEDEQRAYVELGYASLESTAGTYHHGSDVVVLTNPPGHGLVKVIVHELGHRYWYKFMTTEKRVRFNALVQTNKSEKTRSYPSGPIDEDGQMKPVTPVSNYGKSSIEEAFAEAFSYLVLDGDMDRDQVESLRSVLAAVA